MIGLSRTIWPEALGARTEATVRLNRVLDEIAAQLAGGFTQEDQDREVATCGKLRL